MSDTKTCLHCGATMTRRYYDAGQKWANRKACSRSCGYKIRNKIAKEAADATTQRNTVALQHYLDRRFDRLKGKDRAEAVRMV